MTRKWIGTALLMVCVSCLAVSRIVVADQDDQPPEMTLEMYRATVENIAPPLCFLIKDLDVNGDGVMTEADSKAARELKENDPFFVKFRARLRETWPMCDGDRSWKSYKGPMTDAAVKRVIGVVVRKVIPRPIPETMGGGTLEFVGVVLTRWDGLEEGRSYCWPLSTQALKDLQTQHIVFVFDFESKSWKPKISEPVHYFGSAGKVGTT